MDDRPEESLTAQVQDVHRAAAEAKEAAGRTDKGRELAILCTDLEKVAAWAYYHGL